MAKLCLKAPIADIIHSARVFTYRTTYAIGGLDIDVGIKGLYHSKTHLVLWSHAQFPKTLSETLCLCGDIGVRLPGIFAQTKLREHFSTFLFLFELSKNLSCSQAFPIRVYLARVFEKPLHRVDFLRCILQRILQRNRIVVTGKNSGLKYLHLAFYWKRLNGDLVRLGVHDLRPWSLYQPSEKFIQKLEIMIIHLVSRHGLSQMK